MLSRRIGSFVGWAVGAPARGAPTRRQVRWRGPILFITRPPRLPARTACDAGPVGGVRDRAAACLLGLALGDALGAPFEFSRAAAIPEPIPAFELPWNGHPPGTWTDDTAMALELVGSLVERGTFDAGDVQARLVAWLRSGPPDVGSQTRAALLAAEPGLPPGEAARRVWERRGPEVSAGNGSVMYCAPLGAFRARVPERLRREAPALSAITTGTSAAAPPAWR
ncbi:MAG: ADP-ribosylglycohydrolase family protein [Actinomycetota bacterium]